MYKIISYDENKRGEKLIHGNSVFHEAANKKAEYCHVYKDDKPVYDLEFINNNYSLKNSKGAQDNGFTEIFFNYNNYDEYNYDTICLSAIKDFKTLEIEELTEYSVVIAKLAIRKCGMEVYITDPRIRLFMEDMDHVHIAESLPDFPDSMIITKKMGIGVFSGDFRRNHSIPAFGNLFFMQGLMDGKDFSRIKYCQLEFDKIIGIGALLDTYNKTEKLLSMFHVQCFLKENCSRYNDKMLEKYFVLRKKPEDANDENTCICSCFIKLYVITAFAMMQIPLKETVIVDEFNNEIDEYFDAVFGNDKVLGVLIRGTDYKLTEVGPKERQAAVEMLIPKIRRWMDLYKFDKIFLATEDQDILRTVFNEFGKDKVRVISQERFSVNDFKNIHLIKDLEKEKRTGKDYEDALEDITVNYFYALKSLAKCNSFIASGSCSGAKMVEGFNNGRFEHEYIYNPFHPEGLNE